MSKVLDFLWIIVIGLILGTGMNLVSAGPPHVTAQEDWILLALGDCMIIWAVLMIVNLARKGRK